MNEWIKKNRDAIIITGVGIIATAAVVATTYKVSTELVNAHHRNGSKLMSLIASDAGVLDQILAHQEKLTNMVQ